METSEGRIRRVAQRQRGVISRRQALACGFSDDTIQRRIANGVWSPLGHGTYQVFGPTSRWALLAAAVAALPAVISHESAADLHHLRSKKSPPTVTIPHRLSNRFGAVVVHESTDLFLEHITTVDGLPTTTVARTIFDLARNTSLLELRRITDEALVQKRLEHDDLGVVLARIGRRGKPGTVAMRKLVTELSSRLVAPESELERRAIALLKQAGLRPPTLQLGLPWRTAASGRVDLAYPIARLIIELDGRQWHSTAESFQRDRQRDNLAQLDGWMVLRFTWDDVNRRPTETVGQVRMALHSRLTA